MLGEVTGSACTNGFGVVRAWVSFRETVTDCFFSWAGFDSGSAFVLKFPWCLWTEATLLLRALPSLPLAHGCCLAEVSSYSALRCYLCFLPLFSAKTHSCYCALPAFPGVALYSGWQQDLKVVAVWVWITKPENQNPVHSSHYALLLFWLCQGVTLYWLPLAMAWFLDLHLHWFLFHD